MRRRAIIFPLILLCAVVFWFVFTRSTKAPAPASGTDSAGSAIAPASKDDLIVVDTPLPGSKVLSPLSITGKARGNWYFEASFPIVITDWDGKIIAQGHAQANGDWMTTDYVPFSATLTFTPDTTVSNRGFLILRKDNPSGDSKLDDALEIPITF